AVLAMGYSFLARDVARRRQAEDALRESEVFYHSLVESLPQNIFRKDALGRFPFANGRFCETIGHGFQELGGRKDRDFFPPDLAKKYREDDIRVMESGQTIDVVEEHVTPDGQTHFVQVIKTPLFEPNGGTIGIQGIFWDVTERRRFEE